VSKIVFADVVKHFSWNCCFC